MHALPVNLPCVKQLPVITNEAGASPHAGSTCAIGVVTVRPFNRQPAQLYFKLTPDPNNTFFFIFTCTTQYPWVLANPDLSQAMASSKQKRTHTVFRASSTHRSASTSKPRFIGEKQPLENRVDYVRGVTYKAAVDLHEELNDSSYVLLRANNIQDGELRFDDVQYVDRTKIKQKQLLRRGDILFCASSGSRGLVGKAALVRENMPVTFGAFCCVLRPKENEAEYLAHYFQSQQYRRAIEKVCSGSNINNLKAANFFSLVVPHYDDDSTRIISALFDSIDAQIKHAKDQIANLDSLVKSRFVEMFEESDRYNGSVYRLADIGEIASGITKGRKARDKELFETPYLSTANVQAGRLDLSVIKTIDAAMPEIEKFRLAEGDVLMTEGGDPDKVGRGAVAHNLPKNCIHQNHVFRVRLNRVILYPEYFEMFLQSPGCREYFFRASKQTTGIATINKTQLRNMQVLVPPIKAQEEFLAFASQVDKSRFVRDHEINFR